MQHYFLMLVFSTAAHHTTTRDMPLCELLLINQSNIHSLQITTSNCWIPQDCLSFLVGGSGKQNDKTNLVLKTRQTSLTLSRVNLRFVLTPSIREIQQS